MTLAAGTAEFFVLRTPLLPVDTLLDWSSGLGARASYELGEPLEPALAADRVRLRERLKQLIARPEVREAIFVASPSLDDAIEFWLKDPDSDRGTRAERGLVRYLCRMTARPTPFGLFAGISTGSVSKQTRLDIGGLDSCRRHTRLDNDYLFALVQALAKDPALHPTLRFHPNDSLSPGAGRFRYVEARVEGTPPRRSYHLVSAEDTPELRSTLARSADGAGYTELAQALVCDEIELADAQAFIAELIEAQVLVPDIALPVTGSEPLPVLLQEFRRQPNLAQAAELLQAAEATLAAVDRAGLGSGPERYRSLAETLNPLPAKVELATLFQVDLSRPSPGITMGEPLLREILRGVQLLHRLGRRMHDPLSRFRNAFQERYEGREIPLLEALDEEMGLGGLVSSTGDPSPLLRGITPSETHVEELPWGQRENHLLTLLGTALHEARNEISLEPSDLERLALPDQPPLPPSFDVLATVLARSTEAVERGAFRLFLENAGPPGGRFLGRFCHADPELATGLQSLLRAEELHDPDALYAEIVHLPEGRLGNILLRPLLRTHEITYLGRSGAPFDRQLPASDLQLSLSGDHFVLRSARLDRRILPGLTTAHSYDTGLSVYRFLCLLQSQSVIRALGWDWGPLAGAPFLPRVRMGRIILALMRWSLSRDECKRLGTIQGDARFHGVQQWRKQRGLPRWIALVDHDNRLPVDLDNVLSVDAFVHEIKGRESVQLEEVFLGPDDLCVNSPEGRYTHEIVVPFVRPVEAIEPSPQEAEPRTSDPQEHASATRERESPLGPGHGVTIRQFPPGSEWLYTKLYTSPATADEILTDVVGPISRELIESGVANGWFFIRYHDPDHHLRWRLAGDREALAKQARPALEEAAARLLDEGKIWRVQFDTYQREQERYGGPEGILLAERLFQVDSEAVLEILELLEPGDAGLDERWRLGFRGIDQLLGDLGLDLAEKRKHTKRRNQRGEKRQDGGATLRQQLTERYRKERSRIEPLLDPSQDHDSDLAPGLAVFRKRSESLKPLVAELHELERAGGLSVPVVDLASSYVHMHVNRLLRAEQNQHELILHDFLQRGYEARAARAASLAQEPAP